MNFIVVTTHTDGEILTLQLHDFSPEQQLVLTQMFEATIAEQLAEADGYVSDGED